MPDLINKILELENEIKGIREQEKDAEISRLQKRLNELEDIPIPNIFTSLYTRKSTPKRRVDDRSIPWIYRNIRRPRWPYTLILLTLIAANAIYYAPKVMGRYKSKRIEQKAEAQISSKTEKKSSLHHNTQLSEIETKNKAENERKEKIEYYKSVAQSYEEKLVGYYSTSVSLEDMSEHIAILYLQAEECDKAISYFKRVPKPKASSHNLLGLCHQKKGELEAAISEFEKAVMKDFSNKTYHWNLGNVYEKAGRLEEAQREFKVPWGNMMPREANKYVKELEKSMKTTNSNLGGKLN